MKIPLFLQKEKWRLVKIYKHPASNDGQIGHFYFTLLESNKGNRRVDFSYSCPIGLSLDKAAARFDIYHERIRRWELGRFDPDIPNYNQVPEEDLSNALKGTI